MNAETTCKRLFEAMDTDALKRHLAGIKRSRRRWGEYGINGRIFLVERKVAWRYIEEVLNRRKEGIP